MDMVLRFCVSFNLFIMKRLSFQVVCFKRPLNCFGILFLHQVADLAKHLLHLR